LRLYTWRPPALSLGVLQRARLLPTDGRHRGLVLVRRITGGGAVQHGDEELTLSVVAGTGDPGLPPGIGESYAAINGCVRQALTAAGVQLDPPPQTPVTRDAPFDCFARATVVDVTAGGVKVAGAAQRRRRGRILAQLSVRYAAATLAPLVERAVADRLGVTLEVGPLTDREQDRARALVQERYACDTWTYRR
jgi:lipoate-protein ligase A